MQASRIFVAASRFVGRSAARPLTRSLRSNRSAAVGFATKASDPKFDPYSVKHMSDAEQRVASVPVIEVDGTVATCNGGGGALGKFVFVLSVP